MPKKAMMSRLVKLLHAAGPSGRLYLLGLMSRDVLFKRDVRASVLDDLPGLKLKAKPKR